MRSKQQPRPSYRWLKTNDNEEESSPECNRSKEESTQRSSRENTPGEQQASEDRQHENEHDIEHSIPATLIQDPNVERESPRCVSRESTGIPRCPSDESTYSSRSASMALPATLPPSAAAALMAPHPAAVAAYLGAAAAAAAAQQQRLLMSESMDTDTSLLPMISDAERMAMSEAVLDFSRKRSETPKDEDDDSDSVNLSKTPENSPLDLSVSARKRSSDSPSPVPMRKTPRPSSEFKPSPTLSPWVNPVGPHLPYFAAAVAAASLSPKNMAGDWNGKIKHGMPTPNDATKALEKMDELSRLGREELFRSVAQGAVLGANLPPNAAGRHSAWQSHWLNKGAEQAKDVLKCVWCKKSFNSLADMTVHMKEAKHCGVSIPVPPTSGSGSGQPLRPPTSSPSTTSHNSTSSNSSSKPQSDLNLLIKETMPLPRKLVRGQDVWLGKGAEQTRQILKCMWCGESFRSLAEMTSHMQRTQHYTNIISQEQIISWKSSDDSKSSSSNAASTTTAQTPSTTSSHVSAVLTCKVCDQAFSSLKELSNHMVKNSHYKEHIMRSITESGGRRRQTREKRKKSLPVRKLLELERAQHEYKNGDGHPVGKPIRDLGAGSRITCEKCGDKIETTLFVDHIRQCIGGSMSSSQRHFLKNSLISNSIIPPESPIMPGHTTNSDGRRSAGEDLTSPGSGSRRSPASAAGLSPNSKETGPQEEKRSSPSVLNAIEQLIEKSFDTRSRNPNQGHSGNVGHAPIGSSILKRLGIDESVDYTKPLVDQHTMNALRNYHHQSHYGRRERSGSESSSLSERGSARIDSLTPDRKPDPPPYRGTPRSTPDIKPPQPILSERSSTDERSLPEIRVKKEITDDDDRDERTSQSVKVKREIEEDDDDHPNNNDKSIDGNEHRNRATTPTSPHESSISPSSDRSGTPRSSERKGSSSLGALSSMFDNLGGSGSGETSAGMSRRAGSHPLAALQKLCDKTETSPSNRAPPPQASPAAPTPGAILAFSWACNDGVISDSILKCALCDTPFISKGAYRHHLSKMHFVKDGVIPESGSIKNTQTPTGNSPSPGDSLSVGAGSPSGASSPTPSTPYEESPRSKFLKYTELAKQLSSKYV